MLTSTHWLSCDGSAFNPRINDMPFFNDACHHEDGNYIGSFILPRTNEAFDVYIFDEHNFNHQHVCIRYGERGQDYYSAGTVIDLICNAMKKGVIDPSFIGTSGGLDVYRYAAQLIMDRCRAKFTREF